MWGRAFGVRPTDGRDTAVAFATLLAMMAGHAMLETARDALFLAKLPPERLPLAYLAIAALALVASRINRAALARFSRRRVLGGSLAVGAVVTGLFWPITAAAGPLALGALYVWVGLLATVVVLQFWLLLGDVFHVGQAKRLYGLIAAGGLVGATAGSGLASLLLTRLDARALLFTSAAAFALAAAAVTAFRKVDATRVAPRRAPSVTTSPRRDPYMVRLFIVVLLATVVVTGVDFVFKATVADNIDRADLGGFFAKYYAALNATSLLVQLVIAPRVIRTLGVHRAVLFLPVLLLGGSLGLVAAAGLLPALLLRGADGAFRHSLYKTSTEILYLPLPGDTRDRFKALAESLGQRGGQAVASLFILGAVLLGASTVHLGIALAVLAAAWIATLFGLERHYLELFRRQLRSGTIDTTIGVPDLDLRAMEALVGALSSEVDEEVTAALDFFEAYEKTALIPALILYHPSPPVVLRALSIFTATRRPEVIRLAERLLGHEDSSVRAAAVEMVTSVKPDRARLEAIALDESPAVRLSALAARIAAGFVTDDEARVELTKVLEGPDPKTRLAAARTLRSLPAERFAWLGLALANLDEPGLGREVARSAAARAHPSYIPALLRLLSARDARGDARAGLLALGDEALAALQSAMADPNVQLDLRRHIPRTISRFVGHRPAEILFEALLVERDDRVAFKILRGLGRLRSDDPGSPLGRDRILDQARESLTRAIRALSWRVIISAHHEAHLRAKTPAGELLATLAKETEQSAVERVFRLLHILEPTEEFRMIYFGVRSDDAKTRASSREILSHVVGSGLREGILAMVDDHTDRGRLRAAAAFWKPPELDAVLDLPTSGARPQGTSLERAYREVLRAMLNDPSETWRGLAAYHMRELGLEHRPPSTEQEGVTPRPLGELIRDAIAGARILSADGGSGAK